jgi:ABC-2 type transport system ATP-binding protein
MSEMENTADHLLVIGRGKLIADCTVDEFIARNSVQTVRVRTPQREALANAVALAGGSTLDGADGVIVVQGLAAEQIGDLAYDKAIRLHELAPAQASLEEAFMELTASSVEFRAGVPGLDATAPAGQPVGSGEVA